MKKTIFAILTLTLLFLTGCGEEPIPKPTNFEECEQAGYTILESYPRECRMDNGDYFVEDIIIHRVRDIDGCYAPDGYGYDYDIQACINSEFTNEQQQAATIAVEYFGPQYTIAVVEVLQYKCIGCFDVELAFGETERKIIVPISFWEIITNEIEYYCQQYNKDIEVYCLDEYTPVCTYDKDGNEIGIGSNDCYACQDEDVSYYTVGECTNVEEIEYQLTVANHDSEQEIELEITVDNTLLDSVVLEQQDDSVGIPSIEVLTISIPTDTTELTVTELNSGFSESLTLDHDEGIYIKVSYGVPGSVAQGKYITIYQLDEQVMYD